MRVLEILGKEVYLYVICAVCYPWGFWTALVLAWFEIGEVCTKIIVVTRLVEVVFLRRNRLHKGWEKEKNKKERTGGNIN